ncbi:MAG: sulfite exporter TauE/SafE family protein [Reyranellaceae bacterium]
MDAVSHFISLCGQGLDAVSAAPAGLPLALLGAGLAGSLVHCVGMCGPFVLSQVVSDAAGSRAVRYGEWQRLRGAALLPYHLGRLTTYTALGALAGGATALFADSRGFAWLSAGLLALAAVLMVLQAIGLSVGGVSGGGAAPVAGVLGRLAAPLTTARSPAARYALGLVLGLLPCGLLYGALAAAAGTGSALLGGLAMLGFALGTVPALIAVGWLGLIVRRQLKSLVAWVATPLLVVNAVLMLGLAVQRLAAA